MLSREELMSRLSYDRDSGVFIWTKVSPQKNWTLGKSPTCVSPNGYLLIRVQGKNYLAHRLAWLFVHGEWPTHHIDHKNRDKLDNRIGNLRECTQGQNQHNQVKRKQNKSGWKGVSWSKEKEKWKAQICLNKKNKSLGYFDDVKEAAEAYIFAALELHGEYAGFE